jgi:hypothetical protein
MASVAFSTASCAPSASSRRSAAPAAGRARPAAALLRRSPCSGSSSSSARLVARRRAVVVRAVLDVTEDNFEQEVLQVGAAAAGSGSVLRERCTQRSCFSAVHSKAALLFTSAWECTRDLASRVQRQQLHTARQPRRLPRRLEPFLASLPPPPPSPSCRSLSCRCWLMCGPTGVDPASSWHP